MQSEEVKGTLLGSMGIALCPAGSNTALQLEFNVASGSLGVSAAPFSSHLKVEDLASVLDELERTGAQGELEWYICDLERMGCEWEASGFTYKDNVRPSDTDGTLHRQPLNGVPSCSMPRMDR